MPIRSKLLALKIFTIFLSYEELKKMESKKTSIDISNKISNDSSRKVSKDDPKDNEHPKDNELPICASTKPVRISA